jgi:putative membrane protein
MDRLFSLCLASDPARAEQWWSAWSLAPATLGPLLFAVLLYGAALVRQRSAPDRGAVVYEAGAFALGMMLLVVALVSPLCRMAATVAWAHMVQHAILVALAPPLLILGGRPLREISGGSIPVGLARVLHGRKRSGRKGSRPVFAATLYGVAIWFWHVPASYQGSLLGTTEHLLMYASLLGSALLFWSQVVASLRERAHAAAVTVVILLITMVHTGLLGALLTFSRTLWYPLMETGAVARGLAAIEDQQLAGLIMWIPMGFIYLFAAVLVATNALQKLSISSQRCASARPALRLQ